MFQTWVVLRVIGLLGFAAANVADFSQFSCYAACFAANWRLPSCAHYVVILKKSVLNFIGNTVLYFR